MPAVVAGRASSPSREVEISFRVVSEQTRVPCDGTSARAVQAALFKVFGKFPIRLGEDQRDVLLGMAAAAGDGSKPYEIMLEALRRYGAIEVNDG